MFRILSLILILNSINALNIYCPSYQVDTDFQGDDLTSVRFIVKSKEGIFILIDD
jgi:hypothetical protein